QAGGDSAPSIGRHRSRRPAYTRAASTRSRFSQTLFQSGWFIESLMTQTLVVHMIRTRKLPFIQSRPSLALLLMTGLIMATGILIPMGPFAHYFRLQALPFAYFPILAAFLLAYMVLIQMMKNYYVRRYGWQ